MKTPESWNNVVEMFFDQAEARGDHPFLWHKVDGAWRSTSWREAAEQVAKLAGALRKIGVQPGERVVIVSENRPEWLIADFAIMAAGGVTVPAYTTNTERDHIHILDNSGAGAVIVSDARLAKALMPAVYAVPNCDVVITLEEARIGQSSLSQIYSWERLIAESTTTVEEVRSWQTARRDDLACIIYTSGTGGAPRGVQQSHGALLHNVAGCTEVISEDFGLEEEVFLSFLPLSHAYEHTGGQMFPVGVGAEIYYAEGLEKLASNIEEARPTIMVVVPRLFEVLRQRIVKAIEKQGGLSKTLFEMALAYGEKRYRGEELNLLERLVDKLLDTTVRAKVKKRFGGRLKAMVSGGAPLNPDVGIFFDAMGLTLLQGYGQTEAAPVVSVNRPSVGLRMDSVGVPLKATEVKIAEDGEILVRGELVMRGYWRNDEETARAFGADGWLHTGDIGEIDERGRIVITDRKKDIIVNDKGDNVAPQRIEGMLTLEPEIFQAMVYGDKRPYLVGLIVPDPEWAGEWAKANGAANDLGALAGDPRFQAALRAAIDRVNGRLSVVEKVRRIMLTPNAFSVDNGQMTPTLKIKRHVIRKEYGPGLEALYRGG